MKRRHWLLMTATQSLVALGASVGTTPAAAQAAYPNKPIKLIVPLAAGSAVDNAARIVMQKVALNTGGAIAIENMAGASGAIGADRVAKSAPDGYTILIASPSSISVNPALNPKLSSKPGDLAPVTQITTSPLVLAVNPATGIRTVQDLVAAARKEPGKLNYATSGNGSAPHLGAALFTKITQTQMTHIPYKGGALALQSLMAGDTQLTFGTAPSVLPQVAGGRIRVLAVSTRERSALVPDIPGMQEAGLPTRQPEGERNRRRFTDESKPGPFRLPSGQRTGLNRL